MKKILSLIKVSLNHDMNLLKVNTKKQKKITKILLPIILLGYLMVVIGSYSYVLMDKLKGANLEYVVVSIFAFFTTITTLMEGIYKSGNLLFNCKDDDMLLSLPINKKTILFVRMLKFYLFELLYNSLFILPVMIVYAFKTAPGLSYYLVSFVALLTLPIVPIILSCILGFLITYLSSKFKGKNLIQTIFTTIVLLAFMYFGYNSGGFISNIAKHASDLNDLITKIYYPIGEYITLINNFNIINLLIYIMIHILISIFTLLILSKIYFKINSKAKKVITNKKLKKYIIKSKSQRSAFIKKEINKFVSTPVFITNAGFGLVLYIIVCILISLKFNTIASTFSTPDGSINIDTIKSQLPVIAFGIICFGTLMTSITSSMISLEGKTFNLLKSLPIKSKQIVYYKVLTSLVIIIPFILIGDAILFIRFKFEIISMLLLIIASILLPIVAESIGILVNLKYPKIDATNDTEVVKQSMSSLISTFIGMGLLALTTIAIFLLINIGLSNNYILLIIISFYLLIATILIYTLNKNSEKYFNNIK